MVQLASDCATSRWTEIRHSAVFLNERWPSGSVLFLEHLLSFVFSYCFAVSPSGCVCIIFTSCENKISLHSHCRNEGQIIFVSSCKFLATSSVLPHPWGCISTSVKWKAEGWRFVLPILSALVLSVWIWIDVYLLIFTRNHSTIVSNCTNKSCDSTEHCNKCNRSFEGFISNQQFMEKSNTIVSINFQAVCTDLDDADGDVDCKSVTDCHQYSEGRLLSTTESVMVFHVTCNTWVQNELACGDIEN